MSTSHFSEEPPLPREPDDAGSLDDVFPLVYHELRQIAHRQLGRHRAGESFDTTALVHEAYLKLERSPGTSWKSREHFFALSARAMRQILINYARRMNAAKRGGEWQRMTFCADVIGTIDRSERLLAIDEGLTRLSEVDPRACQVVELRFFGGMTEGEIAGVLDISESTVRRDWRAARAFLARHMREENAPSSGETG